MPSQLHLPTQTKSVSISSISSSSRVLIISMTLIIIAQSLLLGMRCRSSSSSGSSAARRRVTVTVDAFHYHVQSVMLPRRQRRLETLCTAPTLPLHYSYHLASISTSLSANSGRRPNKDDNSFDYALLLPRRFRGDRPFIDASPTATNADRTIGRNNGNYTNYVRQRGSISSSPSSMQDGWGKSHSKDNLSPRQRTIFSLWHFHHTVRDLVGHLCLP
jgi:hypothetical protein